MLGQAIRSSAAVTLVAAGLSGLGSAEAQIPVSQISRTQNAGATLRPVPKFGATNTRSTATTEPQRDGWNLRWRQSRQARPQTTRQASALASPNAARPIRQASASEDVRSSGAVRQAAHATLFAPQNDGTQQSPAGNDAGLPPSDRSLKDIDFFEDPFGSRDPNATIPAPSESSQPRMSPPLLDRVMPGMPDDASWMEQMRDDLRNREQGNNNSLREPKPNSEPLEMPPPKPAPTPAPEPLQELTPEPQPAPEIAPVPEPAVSPELTPTPSLQPEPETMPVPDRTPRPQPAPSPEPSLPEPTQIAPTQPEPTPQSTPEPAPSVFPDPDTDPVPRPEPKLPDPAPADEPSLSDLMKDAKPEIKPKKSEDSASDSTLELLPPPVDRTDSEPSASDQAPFDNPFDRRSDADRRDRDRLRSDSRDGESALQDELRKLEDEKDDESSSAISCDDFRSRIARQTIRQVSLDISPPFRPDVIDEGEYQKLKAKFDDGQTSRQWRSIDGRPLSFGRLKDLAYEKVVIETDLGGREELAINRLSESDLAYISENWGLPSECLIEQVAYTPRTWSNATMTWKASNLCHKPLYFEEVNLERYGHTAGPVLQPIVSSAHFFANIAVLPYKKGIHPPGECQYALGYYRPGNCAPWIVPPVPLSARGAVRQAAEMTAAFWLIP